MKNNSILNSLVLAKANAKRSGMALLLGFATLAAGGISLTARAQGRTPAPIQGTWLQTVTRSTKAGQPSPPRFRLPGVEFGKQRVQMIIRTVVFLRCSGVGSTLARISTVQERTSLPLIPAAIRLSCSESTRFKGSCARITSKELVNPTLAHWMAKGRTA